MRSGHDICRRYSPRSGLVRQPELDGLTTEGTSFINQPPHVSGNNEGEIMTEFERLLVTALTEQNQQVDALTEQVGDLVSGQATLAEHIQRLREQLRPYGIY